MPDKKLFTKLDDALALVKKHNKLNYYWACDFVSALLPRLRAHRPFELLVGNRTLTIKPNDVRVSKTTIDFGDVGICLMHVSSVVGQEDDQGHAPEFPAVTLQDGRQYKLSFPEPQST